MAYGDVSWCLCIRSVASKCELRVVVSVWVRSAVVIELMCVCVLFFFFYLRSFRKRMFIQCSRSDESVPGGVDRRSMYALI